MTKFNFKKRYGQNFLKDQNIVDRIVSSIEPSLEDLIIEIGPGGGALTKKLKKYDSNIIAFEIDEDTKKYLLPLEDEKTKIIFQDFLKCDIKKHLQSIDYDNLYIIGNLPYYITTPILEHIIDSQIDPAEIVIMVQKEVADRFLAQPKTKDYGYMTVLLSYNYDISLITDVDKNAFIPAPKVDSAVIKLKKKNAAPIDYSKFKKLLKDSFQFKRKTLKNNLKSYDLNDIEKVLSTRGYSLSNRAEEIDLDTYLELVKNI